MSRQQTYTLQEIEERTGVNKRTIAYYVESGILPSVGRRGRWSRYPQEFLDRLLFINRVRALQDAGKLRAMTLAEIGEVMNQMEPEEIRALAKPRSAEARVRAAIEAHDSVVRDFAAPVEESAADWTQGLEPRGDATPGRTRAGRGRRGHASPRTRRMAMEFDTEESVPPPAASAPAPGESAESQPDQHSAEKERRMKELVREIDRRTRARRAREASSSREQLTRVPVTQTMFISVQNLDEDDAELVEELAGLLRDMRGEEEAGE